MRWRFVGLWRQPDFLKLWAGQTVSLVGSQVTILALPLTAVLLLRASPLQVGILGAAQFLPYLLLTLFAGLWVDRRRRRPVLIMADLGRAGLVGLIPLLAVLGWLRMDALYGIALLLGALTVLFDLAYQSYLPALVERAQLVEGNSKLQVSASVAEIGGPGLAGLLAQVVSAPGALLVDALSFLVSVLSLALIHQPEPAPAAPPKRQRLRRELAEGLRLTFGNRYLRALACEAATSNGFGEAIITLFVLYAVRELGIGPGRLGLILATGSVGALVGSATAEALGRRFGVGPTIVGSMLLACIPLLLVPLAGGPPLVEALLLVLAFFLSGCGLALSNVQVISLRQTITPDHLLGRVNASYRLVVTGAIPLGALFGGLLGGAIGLRLTLLVAAVGVACAPLWVIFSPVPTLRELPAAAAGAVSTATEQVTV
jgi:MFS family permease